MGRYPEMTTYLLIVCSIAALRAIYLLYAIFLYPDREWAKEIFGRIRIEAFVFGAPFIWWPMSETYPLIALLMMVIYTGIIAAVLLYKAIDLIRDCCLYLRHLQSSRPCGFNQATLKWLSPREAAWKAGLSACGYLLGSIPFLFFSVGPIVAALVFDDFSK